MQRERLIRRIKFGIIISIAILILGYALYEAQKIIQGPQIIISSPQNGDTVSQSLVNVKGVVKNINRLALNDRDIFQDEAGNFSEKLLLSYGYNSLKLDGWDKFGRKEEKIIQLIYK